LPALSSSSAWRTPTAHFSPRVVASTRRSIGSAAFGRARSASSPHQPNNDALGAHIDSLITESVSSSWRSSIARQREQFLAYLRSDPRFRPPAAGSPAGAASSVGSWSLADVDVTFFLRYLYSRYVARGLTVTQPASALNTARRLDGGASLSDNLLWARFLRGARKQRPAGGACAGVDVFAPAQLVEQLPLDDHFLSVRLRALVLTRIVTMARSTELWTIARSSVRRMTDQTGRTVVVFNFHSKNSVAYQLASDSNYVEFLSRPPQWQPHWPPFQTFCPATQLLKLVQRVENSRHGRSHDSLFTQADGRLLSRNTLGSLVSDLMRATPTIPDAWSSKHIRSASQQTLELLGVPPQQINRRAGWVAGDDSATRVDFYTHYRLVRSNFADLLLFSW
jgi:hypothetical protein